MISNNNHVFNILLIEDNPDDAMLTRLALKTSRFNCQLHIVNSATDAIDFLQFREKYSQREAFRPDLVLADVKMPGMSGIDFVYHMRKMPDFRRLPIVMLSTSTYDGDIDESYNAHCNAYMVKPNCVRELGQLLDDTISFWSRVIRKPDRYIHISEQIRSGNIPLPQTKYS